MGIDCPEKDQPYGETATAMTTLLALTNEVTITTHGTDKYGRTIGDGLLPDGTNVNHKLVQEGMCWWYRKYAPGDAALERLETKARNAKRGLWVEPNPMPPWEWRHRGR